MAGLIDFAAAFRDDVCLIEWCVLCCLEDIDIDTFSGACGVAQE